MLCVHVPYYILHATVGGWAVAYSLKRREKNFFASLLLLSLKKNRYKKTEEKEPPKECLKQVFWQPFPVKKTTSLSNQHCLANTGCYNW